jgi:serine/threonine protein phosphatase PrpC
MHHQTVGGRKRQEDSFLDNNGQWAVADGLGGHPDGDKASKLAISYLDTEWDGTLEPKTIFAEIDREISKKLGANYSVYNSPATTLLTAMVEQDYIEIANSGDCTCMLIRKDKIVFQTERQGVGSTVTGCLGDGRSFMPTVSTIDYEDGDLLVLFTDGFDEAFGLDQTPYAIIKNSETAIEILNNNPLQEALQKLDVLTREHGSTDNATIVAVRLLH